MAEWDEDLLCLFYRTMVTIRFFEQAVEKHFLAGEIPGFVHLYIGEEAIATGVCANLTEDDYIASTHRGHGHCIAKGADVNKMMAELFGRRTGYCKGKGGSMHIADFSIGMLGANGVVGGSLPIAAGAALAISMLDQKRVTVAFFGDGASNRGTFHESANLASVWKLPVIFLCENNQYASTTPYKTTTSVEDIADRAHGYSMPGVAVDGNDVFAVYEAAKAAIERARNGGGPSLLEAKTYRVKGHFVGDPELYRSKEEVEEIFKKRDPISRFEKQVLNEGLLSQKKLDDIKLEAQEVIDNALAFAKASPEPDPSELLSDVYA